MMKRKLTHSIPGWKAGVFLSLLGPKSLTWLAGNHPFCLFLPLACKISKRSMKDEIKTNYWDINKTCKKKILCSKEFNLAQRKVWFLSLALGRSSLNLWNVMTDECLSLPGALTMPDSLNHVIYGGCSGSRSMNSTSGETGDWVQPYRQPTMSMW